MAKPSLSFNSNLSIPQLFRSITLQEWVSCAVIATALGVTYLFWTYLYEITKPFLKPFGLKYLTSGLWIITSVFLSNLIRKPGIAVFASIVAALMECVTTQWGWSAFVYGAIQGLAAELIFAIFLYRQWSLSVLILAASFSALCSYTYDYLAYEYANLSVSINLLQVGSFIISAIVFGAFLSHYLSKRLLKTGLLDAFLIAKHSR